MRPIETRPTSVRLRAGLIRCALAAAGAVALSGCYVEPYPYRNHYGYGYGYGAPGYYGRPVVVVPRYYRPY